MRLISLMFSLGLLGAVLSMNSAAADYEALRSKISSIIGQVNILSINPTGIDGLLEVEFDNGQALYASADGEYILDGTLYQLQGGRPVDLRKQRIEAKLVPLRRQSLQALKLDDMVVFSPEGEVKARVYAFTDVDCGYCRKLHSEIDAYTDLGIEIRYLAYPRAGVGSGSYKKMVSIWCADDPRQAMTASKAGRAIEMRQCENPVAEQFELGGRLGVTGTPSLLLADGTMMPGYIPAPRLAKLLGIQ